MDRARHRLGRLRLYRAVLGRAAVSAERDPKITQITTPLALAESQYREAIAEVRRDHTVQPQFAWPTAMNLLGPLLPGHLVVVGGASGNGKTTFLINLFDTLAENRWPCLYLTTETRAEELRRLWAAMKLGY